jgi:hypothetical protein
LNTSLNANNQIGYAVSLVRNVSTNTRGILLSSLPATTGGSSVYYLHDLFGSAAPSVAPSVLPTVPPTVSPSGSPTAEPTLTPSARPSASTASLFSYKVVAEIHFNLIDFPGLNESYVAGTKSEVLEEAVKTHEFDRILSYYATINDATQLLNSSISHVVVTSSVLPAPSNAEEAAGLSDGEVAGLVIGITFGFILLVGFVYLSVLKVRSKHASDTPVSIPKIPSTNDMNIEVDITTVYDNQANNLGSSNVNL